MKLAKVVFGSLALSALSFAAGWFGNTAASRGEHAMAAFMTSYSALAYLQRGDTPNAMLLLRASAESNLIIADQYGDWALYVHKPDAMWTWFAEYADLRQKLPASSRGPDDPEFEAKVNAVLNAAVEKAVSRRNTSEPVKQ